MLTMWYVVCGMWYDVGKLSKIIHASHCTLSNQCALRTHDRRRSTDGIESCTARSTSRGERYYNRYEDCSVAIDTRYHLKYVQYFNIDETPSIFQSLAGSW